ncbi:MAG: hypothetical protein ABSE73_07410 [Planctomycetota bacterium]
MRKFSQSVLAVLLMLAAARFSAVVRAADAAPVAAPAPQVVQVPMAEWEKMKTEIENLRKDRAQPPPIMSSMDKVIADKYGPGVPVTTRWTGKLKMGGLMQCWYYNFQQDSKALFNDPTINTVTDTNEASDISSFRIRRMELMFQMDIHENVTAYVKIDPAKEANSFPTIVDNQINNGPVLKTINNIGPEYQSFVGAKDLGGFGSTSVVSKVQSGGTFSVPNLLENAYIVYHGVIPHHEFAIGQFQPKTGESAVRDNGELDFVERSLVGLVQARYDGGAYVKGTWVDDRVQYWFSCMNDPGNFWQTAGNSANRTSDHNNKDWGARLLVRPVWKYENWGSLELGGGTLAGVHGTTGDPTPVTGPENGVDRTKTNAFDDFAWLYYHPGNVVSGLWLRGEWAAIRDRMPPNSVVDLQSSGNILKVAQAAPVGSTAATSATLGSLFTQENAKPITTTGFEADIGYKLSESTWKDSIPCWFKPFEFVGRYSEFQNVLVADAVDPTHTDIYRTKLATAGINYYIKGHSAKIQAEYDWVFNPTLSDPNASFHGVRNDCFSLNFQVEW